jgi:cell division protein FtsX
MSNKKLNVAIVSTMLLLATAVIAMPMKIANAQQQLSTPTNQSGISVDQQISDLKSKFPILSSSQGNEVKDIIQKIQGLDKQQALKTLAAFHILRNLQEYKEFVGSTNSGG